MTLWLLIPIILDMLPGPALLVFEVKFLIEAVVMSSITIIFWYSFQPSETGGISEPTGSSVILETNAREFYWDEVTIWMSGLKVKPNI
jgi:hypothetical protein